MQAVIIVIRGNYDDNAGTMNKKCPEMFVATRVLSKLYDKVTTILNSVTFANRGNNSRGIVPLTLAMRWQVSDCLNTASTSLSK